MAKILFVDTVTAFKTGKQPTMLVVNVVGRSSSSGWTGGNLSERHYLMPPSDGILDFDFYATPPSQMSLAVLSPVAASTSIECPPWCKGVRVHASINALEEYAFSVDAEVLLRIGSRGGDDPWPWLVASESLATNRQMLNAFIDKIGDVDPSVSELVGRPVRVFHESDMITMEHIEGRVNIVLQDGTRFIRRVYFG